MMENYNSDDFAGIRYNVLKEIVAENGVEKVIEYAMDSCDTILLGDLVEIASSIMTKDQLLRCYIRIKDAYDFKIKALKAQNENLKNAEKKKNNQGIIAGNNGEDNRGNIGRIC